MNRTVVVIAKTPVPGRVKTRLCPPFTPDEAARIAAASLMDTLEAVAHAACDRRVLLLDGAPMSWVPSGYRVVAQPDGDLDVRLAAAFTQPDAPTVLIGMDTPQVSGALLDRAFESLDDGADAVLGPACDGGYWLIGLARPRADAVRGVPMSTPWTGRAQWARLGALGLRTARAPVLRDVDTADDASAVAGLVPASRFSATLREITEAHAPRHRST